MLEGCSRVELDYEKCSSTSAADLVSLRMEYSGKDRGLGRGFGMGGGEEIAKLDANICECNSVIL